MTEATIPKCPSCGADLNVTGDGPARCAYCQKDVLVSGSPVASSGPLQNLITLARAATDAGNDEEASTLWTRVLEQDPKNAEAWLGKAKAVPMTIGGMLAGYAQAESYCQKVKACATDGDGGADAVLSHLLDVMTQAAEDHFEEFAEVDGAGGEFMERVFFILDARERLASPANDPVEYQAAIALCDKMLAQPVIAGVSGLSKEFRERRARYLAQGGPLLAQVRAELGDGKEEPRPSAFRIRRGVLVVSGIALVLGIVAVVGFGRWPGRGGTESGATGSSSPSSAALLPGATAIGSESPAAIASQSSPGGSAVPGTIDPTRNCMVCATQEDFDSAGKNHTRCCPVTACKQDADCSTGRVCCRIPSGQLCADAPRCSAVNRVSSRPHSGSTTSPGSMHSRCAGAMPACQPPTVMTCGPEGRWQCVQVDLH